MQKKKRYFPRKQLHNLMLSILQVSWIYADLFSFWDANERKNNTPIGFALQTTIVLKKMECT